MLLAENGGFELLNADFKVDLGNPFLRHLSTPCSSSSRSEAPGVMAVPKCLGIKFSYD